MRRNMMGVFIITIILICVFMGAHVFEIRYATTYFKKNMRIGIPEGAIPHSTEINIFTYPDVAMKQKYFLSQVEANRIIAELDNRDDMSIALCKNVWLQNSYDSNLLFRGFDFNTGNYERAYYAFKSGKAKLTCYLTVVVEYLSDGMWALHLAYF